MPSRDRLYRIGDAAALLELRTSVLRFWETEFPELAPTRLPSGHRAYTEKDLQLLKKIKALLHVKGMTIEGARLALARSRAGGLSEEEKASRGRELEERRRATAERRREWAARRRARAQARAQEPAAAPEQSPGATGPAALPEEDRAFLGELAGELDGLARLLEEGHAE